jgi:hypothetical protein
MIALFIEKDMPRSKTLACIAHKPLQIRERRRIPLLFGETSTVCFDSFQKQVKQPLRVERSIVSEGSSLCVREAQWAAKAGAFAYDASLYRESSSRAVTIH